MRHIIPISGKDSLTTAIVQKRLYPEHDYEFFYNFIGTELPDTMRWLKSVEQFLESDIQLIGSDLESIIASEGILPSPRVRYCTRLAKIKPMQEFFSTDEPITIYYGIRADEQSRAGYTPRNNETVLYPLIDNGIDLKAVYAILDSFDLVPPSFFWRSMFHLVAKLMSNDARLIHQLSRQAFNILFAWRSRPNCYFCFYQKQYEYIGLLEHYPRLYWRASHIEQNTGAKGYTWRQEYSLSELSSRASEIKLARARQIIKSVYEYTQQTMFVDTRDLELSGTSCGLFCGK